MEYKIEQIAVADLKPYKKNAKKHPEEQVERIAESIRQFGFRQNLVIDDQNVVVIGHGRLLAAKKLGLETVPCIRLENLTKDQVKALRLADNRVAESEWDDVLLSVELSDIQTVNMTDFGFEEEKSDISVKDKIRTALQGDAFENQEVMQFEVDNFYGLPEMQATQTYGEKLIRFCDWKEVENPSEYICHFYYDDFKFMQAWRDPDRFVQRLKKFKAVISPDFSLYTDFPIALQILSCYRRQWCGAYWQSLGIDVIPDVVWGDEKSFAFCFEGIPKHSVVAVSTVGVSNDREWNGLEGSRFKAGYDEMLKRLEPTKIIFYGNMIDGLNGDIIRVPSFYEQRRQMLNERKKKKNGNEF